LVESNEKYLYCTVETKNEVEREEESPATEKISLHGMNRKNQQ
jgi:hypothetical protein